MLFICQLNGYGQNYWTENYRTVSTQSFKDGKITLKKKVNLRDYRKNPDGTIFYKTTFAVDLEYNSQTTASVIETDAYTTASYSKGMNPCMLIDNNKNIISIFSNSKAADPYYGMDGFVYRIDMNNQYWKREVVFANANHGWFSFFGGSDNGNPELWHFSFAGYLSILSKRSSSGNWSNQNMGAIRPETADQEYSSHQRILVTAYPNVDRMSTSGNSSNYPSNSSSSSSSSTGDIVAGAITLGAVAAGIYGLYKLFAGDGDSSSSSSYSSSSSGSNCRVDVHIKLGNRLLPRKYVLVLYVEKLSSTPTYISGAYRYKTKITDVQFQIDGNWASINEIKYQDEAYDQVNEMVMNTAGCSIEELKGQERYFEEKDLTCK